VNALRRTDIEPGGDAVEVKISLMRRRHLRAIMRIERQVYPRPWTAGVFSSEMAGRDRRYLVARAGGTVVGYAGMLFSLDDAHVTNIAVDPIWQRHKIGTRLLLTMCRDAIDVGARNMTLEVRVSNHSAQAMYRRFGFAPAGVRARYYENTEDAIVMWAHEVDSPAYRDRLRIIELSLALALGGGRAGAKSWR
jgi:[ribosomal protein S18]-alanine N-acetyltransferase